jgi:nucleoside-diphosphate-sugar epimerase
VRILVTGDRGHIGVVVAAALKRSGHDVGGFDIQDGDDLLDLAAVKRAAAGCGAIVHLGALAHDSAGPPEQIMAVNVLGTWNVLLAAAAADVPRVIHFSSAQVFGTAEGERLPDYFPVDDAHPRRAARPYGLSKRVSEDLCEAFSVRTATVTVSLRPVAVWGPEEYARVAHQRAAVPESEWEPYWEYGAFVDVRDVAGAVQCALDAPVAGHHRALLCAQEISGSAPTLELVERLAPNVTVRGRERYAENPRRALFDSHVAETMLGWTPKHTGP